MFHSKVLKNASWIIVCKIGQSLCSLIVTMLTARYLGPSNYGLINYAAAVIAFVAPIVQLGFGNIQVLELVNRPNEEGKTVGTSLIASAIMGIFGIIGVVAFSFISTVDEKETIIVCTLYSVVLLFQGAELIQFWFQKHYFSKQYSIISLIAFAVVSAYKVFLLISGKGIYWFAVANSIDYILILTVSLIIYKKMGGQKLQFSKDLACEMFKKSRHYILANLMVVIFTQTDRIMLQLMTNSEATGLYSAAATCSCMFNFVFSAIIDSARPTIFERLKESKEKFENGIILLYSIIIYSTSLLCILVTLFSGIIISVIYGPQYEASIAALRIVVWFIPFSFIGSVRNVWLLAMDKQRWLPTINLSGAIANIALNFVLIPIWGIYGAAIASLITQIFCNVIISFLIKDIRDSSILMLKGCNIKLVFREIKNIVQIKR